MGIGRYLLEHALPSHGWGLDAAVRCDHPMYAGGGGVGLHDDGDDAAMGGGGADDDSTDVGRSASQAGSRRPFSKASSKASKGSVEGDG